MLARPFADVAVTLGLALHKIPEGAALGWISQRAVRRSRTAFLLSTGAELFTVLGAFAEPALTVRGAAQFGGARWTAGVLSVVAGGFFFLGFHAIWPARKQRELVGVFLATMLVIGALTLLRRP